MRALVWDHQAADEAAAAALASALDLDPVVARVLALRGLADPDEAARFLQPLARSAPRPVPPRGPRPRRRAAVRRPRGRREDRHPRRLRRGRRHVHGDPAARARAGRRLRDPLHPGPDARRLRPAAGGRRPPARRRRRADRVGGLRHPRRGRGAARARARRRSHRDRPPRAGSGAAAGLRRHQPEAGRLPVPRQEPGGRGRRAEAGAGDSARGSGASGGCRRS